MFRYTQKIPTNATPSNEISAREMKHRKLAREAAAESIVLLKNDGMLPIKPSPVALFGAGAATTIKGGTGSGEVNERYSVTIEEGLKNAGFTITTETWLREYELLMRTEKLETNKALAKRLLKAGPEARINIMADGFQYPSGRLIADSDLQGEKPDVCIYVIARQAGECSDRRLDRFDFSLTQVEIDNLKIAANSYEKTIVVINVGGPMDMSSLDDIEGINAIIFFCQQGMEGGSAFADIITGAVTPSGCLSSTWPMEYGDLPNAGEYSYLKGHFDDEKYKEGIYVGYRYYDSFNITPRYEFGYGLSYTDFSIEYIETVIEKTNVIVKVKVTNIGDTYSGKKCVQLYISAPSVTLLREYQSLAAFAKTDLLAPGQSQSIELGFDITDFAGYDESNAFYILEQGDYILRLGGSAKRTETIAIMELDGSIITEVCTNVCRINIELNEIKPTSQISNEIPDGIRRLAVNASGNEIKEHSYKTPNPTFNPKTEAILNKLTLKDMLKVVVATGVIDTKPSFCVPGSAAYTTSHLNKMGVPNASLCDGPAGVRLQRKSVKLKNGKIKPVDAMMEFMDWAPWLVRKYLLGNPKKGTLLYQYTSAFPVGTALAQTWNIALIEQIGKAIGTEMVEFGVTYLLAPGMNIHRNPLCGRNYEYYSEDPLLTGKMAAAITRGVQSHKGCYATIKHFACNNQETNRFHSNSVVSERTLREIYLKGYRIAIEEAGAKAVMTSYNKVNDVYTPNSYDLCTKILRFEWGFEGVVMTDWLSTGKGLANNGLAIKAGNDLICPGGRYYRKALKKDIKAGVFCMDDLRLSCARVLEAAINGRTGYQK